MNRLIPFVLLLILTSSLSCKKFVENKQRDAILDAMTNGVWFVEQYFENSANITGEFLNYEFQFYENGNVKGTRGMDVANGTWIADVDKYTITADFPTGGDTLVKLNHTWKLTDSYLDYVEAETNTQAGKNILHLRKKS